MPIKWIEHKGKQILYVDYRMLSPKKTMELIYEAAEISRKSEGGVLVVSNFEKVAITCQIMEEAKVLGKEVFKDKTAKSAVLGVTGMKRILLSIYCQFTKDKVVAFGSLEKAVDYLVK
ncbi:hypothetical protein OAH12_02270 [Cyclobacteriaceae bacterium]|nr:hypothetical protein [Cyclobacteriaceae bacterium]